MQGILSLSASDIGSLYSFSLGPINMLDRSNKLEILTRMEELQTLKKKNVKKKNTNQDENKEREKHGTKYFLLTLSFS